MESALAPDTLRGLGRSPSGGEGGGASLQGLGQSPSGGQGGGATLQRLGQSPNGGQGGGATLQGLGQSPSGGQGGGATSGEGLGRQNIHIHLSQFVSRELKILIV